jgi:hypothetical protein
MIVKGVRGRLVDLVENPDKWTSRDVFAAPSILDDDGQPGPPELGQLLPLSKWLAQYMAEAVKQEGDPYFQNFNRIIHSESWTGILFLRVDITNIPSDIVGMLAGVNDPNAFNAHHVGIEISQVDGEDIEVKDSSSIFGLINYVDPGYDPAREEAIPPPDLGATYDFTLLTLRVLFQNSAVTRFHSMAQAVLNRLFGTTVDHMGEGGNIYNAILLRGALQRNGDTPVYSLASMGTNVFYPANDVLIKVEINRAELTTRDDGSQSGRAVSWLGMGGSMALAELKTEAGLPFDIFSFGSDDNQDRAGEGLSFRNLGLRISFPLEKPSDRQLTFETGEIGFDTGTSRARDTSLFRSFQLELQGLASGTADETPSSRGYLTLATPQRPLAGLQSDWHGLVYNVNLGTPGALASKVNLTSTIITAWADDSGAEEGSAFQVVAGIELPGTGGGAELFSLQTVLSVSVGTPRLFYNEQDQSFLLLLSELALKFLGLLKIPPNGSTSFFLFGGPDVTNTSGLGWLAVYNQDQPQS